MFKNEAAKFVYYRTYARWREDLNRRENWDETIERVIGFLKEERGDKIPKKVLRKIKEYMLDFSVMPSMRLVWAAGPAAKRNNATIYNCSFLTVDSIESFSECLFLLCCGTGVGFSVEEKYIKKLPEVPVFQKDMVVEKYVIQDSKEAWADSVKDLIKALYSGKTLEFDYSLIRPKGAPLKITGGRASGPDPLILLHGFIKDVFNEAQGRKLKTIECHDIMNKIAEIVVAGGVRRSSQISLSDLGDEEMRNAKIWPFPIHRAMSNNSAIYYEKPSAVEFLNEWASLASSGTGERGIWNMQSTKKMSPERRDVENYDHYPNPCVSGDTEILTKNGYERIDSVIDKNLEIWNGFEWSEVTPKITGFNQPMVTVKMSDGRQLRCTENHRFHIMTSYTGDSKIVPASQLEQGMKLIKSNFPVLEGGEKLQDAYTHGFVAADGMECNKTLSVYVPKQMCLEGLNKKSVNFEEGNNRFRVVLNIEPKSKDFVPLNYDIKSKLNWLSGFFDGDGCELKEGGLQVISVNKTFLRDVQKLLSTLGVQSKITHREDEGFRKLPDGKGGEKEYFCKEAELLCVGAVQMQHLKSLGLNCFRLSFNKTPNRDASQYIKIESVEKSGVEEVVYCFTEPKRNLGVFNGVLTGQCGEILLRDKQFCNLASVIIRPEDDLDSLLDKVECAAWIGTIQASFTHFPYLRKKWAKNCREEALLGISLSGQMDNPELLTNDSLKALKSRAIKINKKASKILEISESKAITCGKPEGCQTADTYVYTEDGILTLEELGSINGPVWQDINLNVYQEDSRCMESTKFYNNGKSKIKIIKMKSGAELKGTLNHKYRILKDKNYVWESVENIKIGDILPYKTGGYSGGKLKKLKTVENSHGKAKKWKQPEILDAELAYFLGLYFADGSNHNRGVRISGDKTKKIRFDRVFKFLKSLNLAPRFLDCPKTNRTQLYINSRNFLVYLKENDIKKPGKYDVFIPKIIRCSPLNVLKAFIEGYTDGDGCKTDKGDVIVTVSKKMAEDLQICGRTLGFAVSLNLMPPTKSSFGENMRYRITFRKGRFGNLSRTGFLKEYKILNELGLYNLVPDRVVSIAESEAETYDISVPETKTFVANSYISHNTSSQLVASGSGAHPWYSPYFIRRYRISSTDPLFKTMKKQGFKFTPENGQTEETATTWVIAFPVKAPEGAVCRKDVGALDQLEHYKKIQTFWCEHNQSLTAYVKDHEWFDVGNWVYNNWDHVVGVSFLPYDGGHYQQAPYEEITKEEYEKMIADFPEIDYSKLSEYEKEDNTEGAKTLACTGDKCDI